VDINIQQMLFEICGGIAIFLFGIKLMREGLQRSAGEKLKNILYQFTKNPYIGVLAGILVTGLVQSSTAITIITVGLVSVGMMTLRQSIGVILGANIGSTVTSFIIGFSIDEYALPIIAIGAVLLFFFKNHKMYDAGQVIFGLGTLLYGLELLTDGVRSLHTIEAFNELTVNFSMNPIIGVLIGTISTAIIHSSGATVGILQGLYAESLVPIDSALPVLLGDNIGTTLTAVIASIGASLAAKRSALSHVLINVIGTIIFLVFLKPYTLLMIWIQSVMDLNPEMTIAFAHAIFNIVNVLIFLPFFGPLVLLVTKIISGKESLVKYRAKHLDPIFIEQSSSIALGQAKEEIVHMGNFALQGLKESMEFVKTNQQKNAERAYQMEEVLNNLDYKITSYLVELSASSLSERESGEHNKLMKIVKDFERMGDHFENIIELTEYQITKKVKTTETAMENLFEMFDITLLTVRKAIIAFDQNDKDMAKQVIQKEILIDKMERQLRKQHIFRLSSGLCTPQAGMVYIDIISNLERIGDHAVNIANAVIGEEENFKEILFEQPRTSF
jgi:phosphate:Na+ symporter